MERSAQGELAIWSTIDALDETDYVHWLTREHLFERVGVPGFRTGRVLRRSGSSPSEYLMLYELDHADVVQSEGYLARLNDPTPWTQRVMPRLQRFRRGGGNVIASAGAERAYGARIAVAHFQQALPASLQGDAGRQAVRALCEFDFLVSARVVSVSGQATSIRTREKSMRSGDEGEFAGLLVIEATRDDALDQAAAWLDSQGVVAKNAFERYEAVFVASSD